MAKLDTKARNELKDSDFGLPKERKYPLNDEEHVRKAIQFFKYCERTKRNELAMNINAKIKSYGMEIKIDASNPFSKYVNKNLIDMKLVTIVENSYSGEYVEESIRDTIDFISQYPISSCNDMIALEEYCKILIDDALEKAVISDERIYLIETINRHLCNEYKEFTEFTGNKSTMYELVENAKDELISSIDDINIYQKKLPILKDIIESTNNKYHAYRVCCEVTNQLLLKANECDDVISLALCKFAKDMDEVKNNMQCKMGTSSKNDIIVTEMQSIFDAPREWINSDSMTMALEATHEQIKTDLYIITRAMDTMYGNAELSHPKVTNLPIYDDKIKIIDRRLTVRLDSDDMLFVHRQTNVSNHKYIDKIYWDDYTGDKVYYGYKADTNTHYLIAKFERTDIYDILFIELTESVIDFLTGNIEYYEVEPIRFIHISENIASFTTKLPINNVVSEAFAVNEDGDIKITISPKNSYMDSYSSNHKMMVQNFKNKNYEAMKKNLAFVFALIATIERSDAYKKRDPEVMKARAFAINDFNTYLKHIQSVEPDFDFVEYYMASEYDKKIINIPHSTILGVKKLMRTILL